MITNPRHKCEHDHCKEIAIYGYREAQYCDAHRLADMNNLVERECSLCHLSGILDVNGRCQTCDPSKYHLFRLAKQLEVRAWLFQNGYRFDSYDAIVDSKCGRERPDFLFHRAAYDVVLECDELQHSDRNEVCECTRMVNISQSLGVPTVFIRYNPDEYITAKKKHNPSFTKRMAQLKLALDAYLNVDVADVRDKLLGYCTARYLFYDGHKEADIRYDVITPWQ
jgi:hypothetical protein